MNGTLRNAHVGLDLRRSLRCIDSPKVIRICYMGLSFFQGYPVLVAFKAKPKGQQTLFGAPTKPTQPHTCGFEVPRCSHTWGPMSNFENPSSRASDSQMAVGQNQWYHFGVGAPPILAYFSGDWDVHWCLTHGQMIPSPQNTTLCRVRSANLSSKINTGRISPRQYLRIAQSVSQKGESRFGVDR